MPKKRVMKEMKKKLIGAILIVIIVTVSILAYLFFQPQPLEYRTLTINSDTTWTKANSPYTLTEPVLVSSGITLTIEPSVTVNLGSYYMQVDGTLFAQGSSTDKIYFNSSFSGLGNYGITFTQSSISWNEQTATGCLIENAVFNLTPIHIDNVSPKINFNSFNGNGTLDYIAIGGDYSIHVYGGSPMISNNTLTNTGISISGPGGLPTVLNNTITNTGYDSYGFGILCKSNAFISNNVVSGWMQYGGIKTDSGYLEGGGFPIIKMNLIINNNIGIYTDNFFNAWGGNIGTFPTIQNNTISKNSVGLELSHEDQTSIRSSRPLQKIINNNIQDNFDYNFYLNDVSSDINVTYNWWGTTDTNAINQTIYDNKNDSDIGTVNFIPFLTAPNPEAPTIPISTSTPTPTPTQSSPPTQSPSTSTATSPSQNPTVSPATPQTGFNGIEIAILIALIVIVALLIVIIGLVLRKKK